MNIPFDFDKLVKDIAYCTHIALSLIWDNRNGMGKQTTEGTLPFSGLKVNKQDGTATTDVDLHVDDLIGSLISRLYPSAKIVGEESHDNSEFGNGLVFCLDPLDGTHVFLRRDFSKVGSMISVLYDGEIIAAAIGTLSPRKIFVCTGDSVPAEAKLNPEDPRELQKLIPLIPRANANMESRLIVKSLTAKNRQQWPYMGTIVDHGYGVFFEDVDTDGSGSIGVLAMRLYTGQCDAILLPPLKDTPWDSNPIILFNKMMDVRTFAIYPDGIHEVKLEPCQQEQPVLYPQFMIAHTRADAFLKWMKDQEILHNTLS